MQLIDTAIADVKLIQPQLWPDERGLFVQAFALADYRRALELPQLQFVQDNFSRSHAGVLRGLHFQRQQPQGKLVRCTRGQIFDVAVDIRLHSPSYGRWVGVVLDDVAHRQLWIPPGLAHGFLVLSAEGADVAYQCTDYYHPASEVCLRWDDPVAAVAWPLDGPPQLSARDAAGCAWGAW